MSFRPNPKPEKRQKEKRKRMMRVVPKYKKVEYRPTGEAAVFSEIWLEREHKCFFCGCHINEPTASNFAHAIPKRCSEALRLEKENILLACFDCHYTLDMQPMGAKICMPGWNDYLEVIRMLDESYYKKIELQIFKYNQNKALKS